MSLATRRTMICAAVLAATAAGPAGAATLTGRAVLPAQTFLPGPTSGTLLGPDPVNGVSVPFRGKQPVQGISALVPNPDGTYWAMADNGYGSIENSFDHNLRVYRVQLNYETASGGRGTVRIQRRIELRDPDGHIPFPIVNEFTSKRILTGGDFDIESMQRTPDGTLWFGDEFGPFLIHTDRTGKVLEPPVSLPDPDDPDKELRAPQNPYSEEIAALRIMNAVSTHARINGATRTPVFSPWHVMLKDGNPDTGIDNRTAPPEGSGLEPASSEIHDVAQMKNAGFDVVPYTINDKPRMLELMKLGVNGIITDRPDLLDEAAREFDANGDGTAGDYIGEDGFIDPAKFDAQGHRGARNLRPENTIPAFEASLDLGMTTLETDTGVTKDGVSLLSHDPYVEAIKCRRADGTTYEETDQILIKDLDVATIQKDWICDKLFRGATQQNDPALSPVSVAFAESVDLPHLYSLPTTDQLFAFVRFYADYYRTGPGASSPDAAKRVAVAERVRFNLETKINPRTDEDNLGNVFAERTFGPKVFVDALAGAVTRAGLQQRADIQSFDFRTLLDVQERYPKIRTVYLFGDFPKFEDPAIAGSDDGTNMQPTLDGDNTPWMAGLYWPYRQTALSNPFRVPSSGGFEGMALTKDRTKLLPMLERTITGDPAKQLRIFTYDLESGTYTDDVYRYPLQDRATNIGDFQMTGTRVGVVIERDGTQGDLGGYKAVRQVTLGDPGEAATTKPLVDLMAIDDPNEISLPAPAGDIGLGTVFAMPFVTIESVVVRSPTRIVVANDNNFPFSIGRHVGTKRPDDTEFVRLRLDEPIERG